MKSVSDLHMLDSPQRILNNFVAALHEDERVMLDSLMSIGDSFNPITFRAALDMARAHADIMDELEGGGFDAEPEAEQVCPDSDDGEHCNCFPAATWCCICGRSK